MNDKKKLPLFNFDNKVINGLFYSNSVFNGLIIKSEDKFYMYEKKNDSKATVNLLCDKKSFHQVSFNNYIVLCVTSSGECLIFIRENKKLVEQQNKLLYDFSDSCMSLFSSTIFKLNNSANLLQKKKVGKISMGENHALILTESGILYSFGDNSKGQLGVNHDNSDLKELNEPIMITNLLNYRVVDIASGGFHNLASAITRENLTNNKNTLLDECNPDYCLLSWGSNEFGQLGRDSTNCSTPELIYVENLQNKKLILSSKSVFCGENYSIIQTNNGLLIFGDNNNGLVSKKLLDDGVTYINKPVLNTFSLGITDEILCLKDYYLAYFNEKESFIKVGNNCNNSEVYKVQFSETNKSKTYANSKNVKVKDLRDSNNNIEKGTIKVLNNKNTINHLSSSNNSNDLVVFKSLEATKIQKQEIISTKKISNINSDKNEDERKAKIFSLTKDIIIINNELFTTNPNIEILIENEDYQVSQLQIQQILNDDESFNSPRNNNNLNLNLNAHNKTNSTLLLNNQINSNNNNANNYLQHAYNNFSDDFMRENLSENASTNEIFESNLSMNIDQPMEELRSYINMIGLSIPESHNLEKDFGTCNQSFRPSNLPKKSKQEEELHRKLVEENRRLYLSHMKEKQVNIKEQNEVWKESKFKDSEQTQIWEREIIPYWFKKRRDNELRKYFYDGVPSCLRSKIWLMCIGNNFSVTPDYYQIEVKKAIQILESIQSNIDKEKESENEIINTRFNIKIVGKEHTIKYIQLDIQRTFHYLGMFKDNNSQMSKDLEEILEAFVVSRPDIGYVQGLSYIGGMLLLYLDKFQSFVALMNIVLNPNLVSFYRFNENQIQKRLMLFEEILEYNLPEVFSNFKKIGLLTELYLIEWIMTIFSKNLNIDVAARIWDLYMIEGVKALYQAAISILTIFKDQLLTGNFETCMLIIKGKDLFKIEQEELINHMKKTKLSDSILFDIQKLDDEYIPLYTPNA